MFNPDYVSTAHSCLSSVLFCYSESIEAAFERVVQTKSEDRKPLTLEDETEDNGKHQWPF